MSSFVTPSKSSYKSGYEKGLRSATINSKRGVTSHGAMTEMRLVNADAKSRTRKFRAKRRSSRMTLPQLKSMISPSVDVILNFKSGGNADLMSAGWMSNEDSFPSPFTATNPNHTAYLQSSPLVAASISLLIKEAKKINPLALNYNKESFISSYNYIQGYKFKIDSIQATHRFENFNNYPIRLRWVEWYPKVVTNKTVLEAWKADVMSQRFKPVGNADYRIEFTGSYDGAGDFQFASGDAGPQYDIPVGSLLFRKYGGGHMVVIDKLGTGLYDVTTSMGAFTDELVMVVMPNLEIYSHFVDSTSLNRFLREPAVGAQQRFFQDAAFDADGQVWMPGRSDVRTNYLYGFKQYKTVVLEPGDVCTVQYTHGSVVIDSRVMFSNILVTNGTNESSGGSSATGKFRPELGGGLLFGIVANRGVGGSKTVDSVVFDTDQLPVAKLHHMCTYKYKINPVTFVQSTGKIEYGDWHDDNDAVSGVTQYLINSENDTRTAAQTV